MDSKNKGQMDYGWMKWLSWGLGIPIAVIFIVGFGGNAGMSPLSWIIVGLLMAGSFALDIARKRLESGQAQNRRG